MRNTFALLSLLLLGTFFAASAQDAEARKPTKKAAAGKKVKSVASAASFHFFNAIPKATPTLLLLNDQPNQAQGQGAGEDSGLFRLAPGKYRLEIQNGDLAPLKLPLTVKQNEAILNLMLLDQVLDAEQKVTEEKIRLHSVPLKKGEAGVHRLSLLSACAAPHMVKVNKDAHELAPLELKQVEGWKGGGLKAEFVDPKEGGVSDVRSEPASFTPDMAAHYILVFFDQADGSIGVRMLLGF